MPITKFIEHLPIILNSRKAYTSQLVGPKIAVNYREPFGKESMTYSSRIYRSAVSHIFFAELVLNISLK